MKYWLEQCSAQGGGDGPEAVADGLHATLDLSWRVDSTKICILISDAPPHGLDPNDDTFPNGCPLGLDPLKIVREMAEKHITLYCVGVEPPIGKLYLHLYVDSHVNNYFSLVRYRDFFMTLAYITGGQYVPMVNSKLLAKVIIGGVREEISLERLMLHAQADIDREMQQAEAEGLNEDEKVSRINKIFAASGARSTQMQNHFGAVSTVAKDRYAQCVDMGTMQSVFLSVPPPSAAVATEETFDLAEYEVINQQQCARMYQKWHHRRN